MPGRRWRVLLVAIGLIGCSTVTSWGQSASLTVSVSVVRPCTVDVSATGAGSTLTGGTQPVALEIKCGTRGAFTSQAAGSGLAVVPGAPAPAIVSATSKDTHQLIAIDF
jgi:hypothetical protein